MCVIKPPQPDAWRLKISDGKRFDLNKDFPVTLLQRRDILNKFHTKKSKNRDKFNVDRA
jgi:hypothetical protein